jgi:hypothetical protein
MKNLQYCLITGTLLAGLLTNINTASGAQKLWGDATGDNLWSTGGNWSPTGAPGVSDTVIFTNAGFSDLVFGAGGAVSNIVDAGFLAPSINSLGYMNTNGFHNTQLTNLSVLGSSATDVAWIQDDGQPGFVFVGSGLSEGDANATVYASIIGNSLTLSNVFANLIVSQTASNSGTHRATLDLTNLNTFNCTVSNVLVGHNFAIPDQRWRPTGTLLLAKTNNITTQLISVASVYQNAGGTCFIDLGTVNTINADKLRIGVHKNTGVLDLQPDLVNPSVKLRDAAGTGRAISWEIGDMFEPNTNTIGFFASGNATGTIDLGGATVDALVDRITLGRGQIQVSSVNRAGDGVGTLTYGGGTIDANTIDIGIQYNGPFIGGSVGRGTLNVNSVVGSGLLIVRSNIVMAVQYAGATTPDATGSQGTINVGDGSTVEVYGDILSGGSGGGTATINLGTGSLLNMKPTGDTTAGNVSINILNVTDGYITNYATLSLTNINILAGNGTFTVYPGQAIAPARVGVIGPLSIGGNLTLRGNTLMDISKSGSTLTNDAVDATSTIDLGGTLTVTYAGPPADLAAGDKFTLFAAVPVNSSPTLVLPPPGSGLAWTNKIFVDGSIEIIPCACGEPTTPPTITMSTSPTSIGLSWPVSYTSFVLLGQTNPITIGLSSNWGAVPGVAGNAVTIPIDPANGTVFFRLFQQ